MSAHESTTDRRSLYLPRILCLHGGGSNARIFRAQCRGLRAELANHFRFVFAQAPFASEPGPDVTSVYESFGPFKRWLRSGPHQPQSPAAEAVERIEAALNSAMDEDDRRGARGEWVAVLGFSQGCKIAASLLLRQQLYAQNYGQHYAPSAFRFAVLMAGRAPLVSLDGNWMTEAALYDASHAFNTEKEFSRNHKARKDYMLKLPTIHVHGLNDPGLDLHRAMLDNYCAAKAKLVEWDGAHRVPIKTKDIRPVVHAIMDVARDTGALHASKLQQRV